MKHFYEIIKEQQEKEKKIIEEFNGDRKEQNFTILDQIAKLGYDWNGYGAESFPSKLIDKCKKMLSGYVAQPHTVLPTGRMSIQFEYRVEYKAYLELEVYEDKITYFILIGDPRGENINAMKTILDINESKVMDISLLSKLFALEKYPQIYNVINYKGVEDDQDQDK